jgi:hypothetical protein
MILARSSGADAEGLNVGSLKLCYESSARAICEAVRLGFSRRLRDTSRKYWGGKVAGADCTIVQISGGRPDGIVGVMERSCGKNLVVVLCGDESAGHWDPECNGFFSVSIVGEFSLLSFSSSIVILRGTTVEGGSRQSKMD